MVEVTLTVSQKLIDELTSYVENLKQLELLKIQHLEASDPVLYQQLADVINAKTVKGEIKDLLKKLLISEKGKTIRHTKNSEETTEINEYEESL